MQLQHIQYVYNIQCKCKYNFVVFEEACNNTHRQSLWYEFNCAATNSDHCKNTPFLKDSTTKNVLDSLF